MGWSDLNLIYEIEPAGETPEIYFRKHSIIIALDNFCASYMLNGSWRHTAYAPGEIAIIPATELFRRTQIDRPVPLIELFLEPTILARAVGEVDAETIELLPQRQLQDPLIQHMGLVLKAELEVGGADSRLYAESDGYSTFRTLATAILVKKATN